MWRNWQTRMVQVHVLAREWRFKSSHPHQTLFISACVILKAASSRTTRASSRNPSTGYSAPPTFAFAQPSRRCRRSVKFPITPPGRSRFPAVPIATLCFVRTMRLAELAHENCRECIREKNNFVGCEGSVLALPGFIAFGPECHGRAATSSSILRAAMRVPVAPSQQSLRCATLHARSSPSCHTRTDLCKPGKQNPAPAFAYESPGPPRPVLARILSPGS